MSEEWFDVVDERDRVTGRARRSEVHARGWRHRAVHVLVVNARGEIFLQRRSWTKDTFPGAWDSSASGHLDAGEDYDAAAVRELREELGCVPAVPPARALRLEAGDETGQEFVWVYRCAHEGPFALDPQEILEGGWFAPAAIDRWVRERPDDFARAFRLVWRRWREGPGAGG